jgi:hypothetical protein
VQNYQDRNESQVIRIFLADVSCFNSCLNLTTLGPEIVAAILNETLPSEVMLLGAGGRDAGAVGGAVGEGWRESMNGHDSFRLFQANTYFYVYRL